MIRSEQADPVAYFLEIAARHPRCFWLDGGGAREWSRRRSLIGWLDDDDVSLTYDAARGEVTRHVAGRAEVVGDDSSRCWRRARRRPPTTSGSATSATPCRPDLPAAHPGSTCPTPSGCGPARAPLRPPRRPAADPPPRALPEPAVWSAPRTATPAGYATAFAPVQEQLHAGNSYEVNLTYRHEAASDLDPAAAYLRLRDLNPAPYAGFLQHDVRARAWLLSSSPERYALMTADRTIETKPIKGTTPRGATAAEDEVLRERLASDPKFRAENLMIVDLLRNDLSMVCEPGTVEVPTLMEVESYESVHQLVSTVRGRLRDDVTTVGALRALFPAGSMTGAPKLRTMQIIEDVEDTPRGAYAGAFGWISADGRADLGVVIRTLTTDGDGRYLLGTGGGITVRSDVTTSTPSPAGRPSGCCGCSTERGPVVITTGQCQALPRTAQAEAVIVNGSVGRTALRCGPDRVAAQLVEAGDVRACGAVPQRERVPPLLERGELGDRDRPLPLGLPAIAQSTTWPASTRPVALVVGVRVDVVLGVPDSDSGPVPPEWSQTPAATVPPGRSPAHCGARPRGRS